MDCALTGTAPAHTDASGAPPYLTITATPVRARYTVRQRGCGYGLMDVFGDICLSARLQQHLTPTWTKLMSQILCWTHQHLAPALSLSLSLSLSRREGGVHEGW